MESIQSQIQHVFIQQYSKYSYEKMSVKSLCEHVPIARTTFYAYYDNLNDIKNEVENDFIKGICQIEKEIPNQNSEVFVQSFFEKTLIYIQKHWQVAYAFLVAYPNYSFVEKWKQAIMEHFLNHFPNTSLIVNSQIKLDVIASSIISAYTYWMKHPEQVDMKELSQVGINMMKTIHKIL